MTASPRPSQLRHFIQDLLRGVGPVIVERFGRTGPLSFKYGKEAITAVDSEVEDILTQQIRAAFPDHAIDGEERGQSGGGGDEAWVWHIDPIDGTLNYSLGIPNFSSTIAVSRGGRILAGAVLEPLRGEMFSAARGDGAYVGDARIYVSDRGRLADAIASTHFSKGALFLDDKSLLQEIHLSTLKSRRLGSIALELAYVAAGRFDLLLAGKNVPQNLYDVAAGVVLVEEAGGRNSARDGSDFHAESTELIASNGLVHDEIIALIRAHQTDAD